MAFTKKKIISLSLILCVIIAILIVAVFYFFLQSKQQKEGAQLVANPPEQTETGVNYSYSVIKGIVGDELPPPLPFYKLEPPDGFVQQVNAEESANRFSMGYFDAYFGMSNGVQERISFQQNVATDGFVINIYTSKKPQEVQFGDLTVLYSAGDDYTKVDWIYESSLLSITSSKPRDVNEMLELVSRVNYEAERQPIYSPLKLNRGGARTDMIPMIPDYYESSGNPEIPQIIVPYEFSQLPEGFRQTAYLEHESAITVIYEKEDGYRITIKNQAGIGRVFDNFDMIQLRDPETMARVLDVTVQGNAGFYYQTEAESRLAWTMDYLTIEMIYQGQITQEEMLALAESLVQTPLEEEASSQQ